MRKWLAAVKINLIDCWESENITVNSKSLRLFVCLKLHKEIFCSYCSDPIHSVTASGSNWRLIFGEGTKLIVESSE